jgi:hypothetical protein
MRSGIPAALKVFAWSLVGGVGTGYLAFRVVMALPPSTWERPERILLAFGLAAATGVAGAVTSGVVAGKLLRG